MTGAKSTGFDLWGSLSKVDAGIQNTTDAAIVAVLDTILAGKTTAQAFKLVMLSNNLASTYKNVAGQYAASTNESVGTLLDVVKNTGDLIRSNIPTVSSMLDKALAEPNIAGIPISTAKVETDKNVEISESMVIVQASAQKKYWTDNAVPRLKEWQITGYLTSLSPLDNGLTIKPSLNWQIYYLNVCADSRRPVLFKTNRNEFVKVQITNLHTIEEATYNNSIAVSITLKEYNPYFISDTVGSQKQAIRTVTGGE